MATAGDYFFPQTTAGDWLPSRMIVGDYPFYPWWGVTPPDQTYTTITVSDTTQKAEQSVEGVIAALRRILDDEQATVRERLDAANLILDFTRHDE